ncbi:MAG: hypothetical protein ACLT3H_08270 [Roseburia sp.]
MPENSFTKSVKPSWFSVLIKDVRHFLTTNLRESEKLVPDAP